MAKNSRNHSNSLDIPTQLSRRLRRSSFRGGWSSSCSPFSRDEERRPQIRAELDACYAHLYGLTRDELRYILDPKEVCGEDFPSETFRVLKEREETEIGEYRTRRLLPEAFDELAESDRFKGEMPDRKSVFGAAVKKSLVAVQ